MAIVYPTLIQDCVLYRILGVLVNLKIENLYFESNSLETNINKLYFISLRLLLQ